MKFIHLFVTAFLPFICFAQEDSANIVFGTDVGVSFRTAMQGIKSNVKTSVHAYPHHMPIFNPASQFDVPGFNYSLFLASPKTGFGLRIGHTIRYGQVYDRLAVEFDTAFNPIAYNYDKSGLMHDFHFGLFKKFKLNKHMQWLTELQYSKCNSGLRIFMPSPYHGRYYEMSFEAYSFFTGLYYKRNYLQAGVHYIPNLYSPSFNAYEYLIDFELKVGRSINLDR